MTTSLSIDSTTSSLLENSQVLHKASSLLPTSDQSQNFQSKKGSNVQKQEGSSGFVANNSTQNGQQLQSPVSGSTNSTQGGNNKKRSNQDNSGQQSSLNFNSTSSAPFQILYPTLYQKSQQSAYFSNNLGAGGTGQTSSLSTSQSTNSTTSNGSRRCGKKKQNQNTNAPHEQRLFFNIKKKEIVSNQKGHSQVYKQKTLPSLTEWFSKLSVEERVNSLTTISFHLTEILINMYQKQESSRKEYLFAENQQQLDKPPFSYSAYQHYTGFAQLFANQYDANLYYQQESQSYRNDSKKYASTSSGLKSLAASSLDETFYCRERHDVEISTLLKDEKEKDKLIAEKEVIKNLRVLDFFQYLDTITVTPELVQDSDKFFKLLSDCTMNQAFSQPCVFKFDSALAENQIEDPVWFKRQSFHSLGGWIVATLEQNLWANYNFQNNQNLNNIKVNELPSLFKERNASEFSENSSESLAKFWSQLSPAQKKALQENLKSKSVAIFQNESDAKPKFRDSGAMDYPPRSLSYQSYAGVHHAHEYESQLINGDLYMKGQYEEKQYQKELQDLIEKSNKQELELEFVEFLAQSPLWRADKRVDKICREFFKILKHKYQEDLVENLLKDEAQPKNNNAKWGGAGKRKKKKNLQQNQTNAQSCKMEEKESEEFEGQQQQLEITIEQQDENQTIKKQNQQQQQQPLSTKNSKKKNNKKKVNMFSPVVTVESKKSSILTDSQTSVVPTEDNTNTSNSNSSSMATTILYSSQSNTKKKKKGVNKLQSQNENNQSFDDSLTKIRTGDIIGIQKSSSLYEEEYNTPNQMLLSVDNDQQEESENFKEGQLSEEEFDIKQYVRDLVSQVCKNAQETTPIKQIQQQQENSNQSNNKPFNVLAANLEAKKQAFKKKVHLGQECVVEQEEQIIRKTSFNKQFSEDLPQQTKKQQSAQKQQQQKPAITKLPSEQEVQQIITKLEELDDNEHKQANNEQQQQQQQQDCNQDTQSQYSSNDIIKKKRNRKKGKLNDQDIMNKFMKNLQSNSEDTTTTENDTKSEKNGNNKIINNNNNTQQQQKKQNYYQQQNNQKQNEVQQKQNYSSSNSNNISMEETKTTQNKQKLSAQPAQLSKHQSQSYQTNSQLHQKPQQQQQYNQNKVQQKNHGYQQQTNNQQQYQQQQTSHQQYKQRGHFNGFARSKQQNQYQQYQQNTLNNSNESSNSNDAKSEKQQPNSINVVLTPVLQASQSYNQGTSNTVVPKQKTQQAQNKKSIQHSNNNNNQPQAFKRINFKGSQFQNINNNTTEQEIDSVSMHSSQSISESQLDNIETKESEIYDVNQMKHQSMNEIVKEQEFIPNKNELNLAYKHQSYVPPHHEELIIPPPTIQSPLSSVGLSTQAQCFTPKDAQFNYTNYNNSSNNNNMYYQYQHQQNYNNNTSNSYNQYNYNNFQFQQQMPVVNGGGYQSYQGTPNKFNKTGYQQRQSQQDVINYEPQQQQKNKQSYVQSQQQQQQQVSYLTPPSVSKKPHQYYNANNNNANAGQTHQNQVNHLNGKQHQQQRKSQKGDQYARNGTRNNYYQKNRVNSQEDNNLLQGQTYQQLPIHDTIQNQEFSQSQQYQIFDYYDPERANMMCQSQNQMIYTQPQQQQQQPMFSPNSISSNGYNNQMDPSQNIFQQLLNQLTTQTALGGCFPQQLSNSAYSPSTLIPEYHSPLSLLDNLLKDPQAQSTSQMLQNQAIPVDPDAYVEAEQMFYSKLDQDIINYIQEIKQNVDSLNQERTFVLDHIQKISKTIYHNQEPKVIMFGSLVTGLALESSDMDLAIKDLKIDDRYIMIAEMQKLAIALQDWKCLTSFKFIETASIPVIKMKVDLQLLREQQHEKTWSTHVISDEQRFLSVDITFDDCSTPSTNNDFSQTFNNGNNYPSENSLSSLLANQFSFQPQQPFQLPHSISPQSQHKTHLGLESCYLVQNYIHSFPNLKEVAILLKKFLAINDLNSPYHGGLSSYSTVLLIVAYMNYFKLRNNTNEQTPSQLLMGFLDFYGNYFNPNTLGINVYNEGSYFQQLGTLSLHDSNFVILDPLNLQNNTTRNSYLTSTILQKFQSAFNNMKSLILKTLQNKADFQENNEENAKNQGKFDESQAQNTHHIEDKEQNMQIFTQNYQNSFQIDACITNSIRLSDVITNIESLKQGNFAKVINSLEQNNITLDIDTSHMMVQKATLPPSGFTQDFCNSSGASPYKAQNQQQCLYQQQQQQQYTQSNYEQQQQQMMKNQQQTSLQQYVKESQSLFKEIYLLEIFFAKVTQNIQGNETSNAVNTIEKKDLKASTSLDLETKSTNSHKASSEKTQAV